MGRNQHLFQGSHPALPLPGSPPRALSLKRKGTHEFNGETTEDGGGNFPVHAVPA